MPRNDQLIRQHRLIQIMERYRFGRTLPELRDEITKELGLVSLHKRSVRRDLDALSKAGFDIQTAEAERGTLWKLGPRYRSAHRITISSAELIALSLGRDLLHPLVGTFFWQGIETFWNKIQDQLPSGVMDHYAKYRKILRVLGMPAKSYEKQQGIIKAINRAILERLVVEIEYQPLGQPEPTKREIEPYGIAFYHSSLYVVADSRDADEGQSPIRHLKLDRFRKAITTEERFVPREDFDLDAHLQRGLGMFAGRKPIRFKVKVSSYAAPWVEEDPWHPDQKIQRHADGSITLTVQASHDLEVIPKVLALGAEAELISPASARQHIAMLIQDMHKRYASD